MISRANFKARLFEIPKVKDKDGKFEKLENFTVGKKYTVYAVFDSGGGYTDFLVASDSKEFTWLNISIFRSK